MKCLVTGADGFVGRWLTGHLRETGDEVLEAVGSASTATASERMHLDIQDRASVDAVIQWASPDAIYHLAGIAFGPEADRSVVRATEVNVIGTAALLSAAQELASPPIVLIPSSSDVYGSPVRLPIDESHPLRPARAYASSKLAQEAVALSFHQAGSLPVVIARAFNHIGPGQREQFVVPSLALQLARAERGRGSGVLHVGNLDAERDFTDVRDVVRAYRGLVLARYAGDPVNVASGSAVAIRSLLDTLVAISGVDVEVQMDPTRLRPFDVPRIVGSATKIRDAIGWKPVIPLSQTLSDIWDDARHRAAAEGV